MTELPADLPEAAAWVDERGSLCPAPIIALGKAAEQWPSGTVIGLLTDDAAAAVDVPAWCRMRSATLLDSIELADSVVAYTVELG